MDSGWIKLWRQVQDSQVWPNPDLFHLWVYCLLRANHATKWVPVPGLVEPIKVERGQFVTGRYALHEGLYPKKAKARACPKTVWRWLQKLETMSNLSLKVSSKYTLVTIANWERYQGGDSENVQANVQQVSSNCPADVQQVSTNKNDKKKKNEKKNSAPSPYREFTDAFCESWKAKYGESYPWAGAKDGNAAKFVWEAVGHDLAKARRVFGRYFAADVAFWRGHTLAKLEFGLAEFLPEPTAAPKTGLTALEILERQKREREELEI